MTLATYVAAGEVTTLEHELWNHTVELAVLVAEALLLGAESTEVLSCLGDNIVVEVEVDAAVLSWAERLVLLPVCASKERQCAAYDRSCLCECQMLAEEHFV